MNPLEQLRARLGAALDQRAAARKALDAILEKPIAENRALSDEETTKFDEQRASVKKLDDDIARMRVQEADLVALAAADLLAGAASDEARAAAAAKAKADEEARAAAAAAALVASGAGSGAGGASGVVTHVGEPELYRQGGEHGFFLDLMNADRGDIRAMERLHRSTKATLDALSKRGVENRETRANSTTDGAGGFFVPPLYMIDRFAPVARPSRPLFDRLGAAPLPGGTDTLKLPRITTGVAIGLQTADNAALTTQDIVDAEVSEPVVTYGGYWDGSLQLLEQSAIPMDPIIRDDLNRAYATQVDSALYSGAGTGRTYRGFLNLSGTNAVTAATATAPALYSKIADAIQRIHTLKFDPPTAIWMHPRRWAFFLAAVDSQNRPLIVPTTDSQQINAMGSQPNTASEGYVGTMQGLPVFVDASIPINLGAGTNEDRIFILRETDLFLWEGTPRVEMFREPLSTTLGARIRLYAYSGFIPGRFPQSVSVISGAGLVTPTF